MSTNIETKMKPGKGDLPENSAVVSPKEWEAAREKLLLEEKALTHARDAMAAKLY